MCEMSNAVLDGANLMNTKCHYTVFKNASLIKADLTGADVREADFQEAVLFGAVLRCSELNRASLQGALFDESTIWPEGFDPLQQGAIYKRTSNEP